MALGETTGDELNLRAYVDVLRRRWWIVVAVTPAAAAVALMVSLTLAPVYQSSATIAVDRTGSRLSLSADLPVPAHQSPIETFIEIARSRSVAEMAARRLGVRPSEIREAARDIQGRIRITRVRGADIIRIEGKAATAGKAASTANAVADSLLAWHVEMRRTQASASRAFIESQLQAGLISELIKAEEALSQYKAKPGQAAISEQTTLAVEKIAEFEAQRRVNAAERQGVEAALRQANATLLGQTPTIPLSVVTMEDPVSTELRQELAKLEIDRATLLDQFTPSHPQVKSTEARLAEVMSRLRDLAARQAASSTVSLNPVHQEILGRVTALRLEREALIAKERAMRAIVDRYVDDARSLPVGEMELARLSREFKIAEQTYLLLSQRLQEAKLAEASVVGDLRVVDRAIPPLRSTWPRHTANTVLAGFVGLIAGIAAAFIFEVLDATFKTPQEVGRALGLAVLATIPLRRQNGNKESRGQIAIATALHPRSPFAEAFRHLRTSLLYSSPDRPLRRILITSAGPAEGKGTVATNLAVGFAQMGRRVWLMECDLRRPVLTEVFQPRTPYGLSELLVDGLPVEDVLQNTTIANLFFLPGGTVPPNPAELLGSAKMRALLASDGREDALLVLDAPPVLPVTDSEVLAPMVDGVVLVVHLGKTPRAAAREARDHLTRVGARLLGVVVNGVPIEARRHGYYSSYYLQDEESGNGRKTKTKTGAKTGGSE